MHISDDASQDLRLASAWRPLNQSEALFQSCSGGFLLALIVLRHAAKKKFHRDLPIAVSWLLRDALPDAVLNCPLGSSVGDRVVTHVLLYGRNLALYVQEVITDPEVENS